MNVGVDVTTSEFLPEFTPKFLLSEVILAVNSKHGKCWLFCLWVWKTKRKQCLSSVYNVS